MKRFNVAKEERKLNRKNNIANNIKIRTIILSIFVLVGSIMLFTYSKYSTSVNLDIMHSKVANFMQDDYILKAYVDGELDDFPGKNDGYYVDDVVCNKGATGTWDDDEWGIVITNATEEETECSVYFVNNTRQYEVTIYGGKNENVLITTSEESITKTLNSDGYLATTMELSRGENITLKGLTSNYENTVQYNGESKLYARPEHIIFWHGIVNSEYGGVSAYPFKSWSSASPLSPTITSTDDYINAKISSSGWTTYSGGWGATDLVDVTNFNSLKINAKSGYVKLTSSGNGINGSINLVSISKGSAMDSSTGVKKELVFRVAKHSDGTVVSGAGTTNMTPGVYTANISSLSGNYTVGIYISLLYGTAEINFDEMWLE